LLWLACSPPPKDSDEQVTLAATDLTSPELLSPAEAIDLDSASDILHAQFIAAPMTYAIGGQEVEGYAYNEQIPGPTLRAKVGDTLIVELDNQLGFDTTIHWHGVKAPYAMDGVPWLANSIVPSDEVFTYTFELTHAGTFWYHPHIDTQRQVDLGLYGALIVEDPADPTPDVEHILLFDSWGEHEDSDGHADANSHHGYDHIGSNWTINGLSQPTLTASAGQSVLLRLINVSNVGYLQLDQMLDTWHVGSEQGWLPTVQPVEDLLLGPGERALLEVLPESSELTLTTKPHTLAGSSNLGENEDLLFIKPQEAGTAHPGLDWPGSELAISEDPGFTDLVYSFSGDEHTGLWLINGESYPDITVNSLALDSDAIIEVRNLSPTQHPFHLHGHEFEVLSMSGEPPPFHSMQDTVNIGIYERLRIKLHADNPGDWMTHCHILPHAHGGMMTVLRVE